MSHHHFNINPCGDGGHIPLRQVETYSRPQSWHSDESGGHKYSQIHLSSKTIRLPQLHAASKEIENSPFCTPENDNSEMSQELLANGMIKPKIKSIDKNGDINPDILPNWESSAVSLDVRRMEALSQTWWVRASGGTVMWSTCRTVGVWP